VRSSNPGQAANRQRNRGTDRSDSQGKSLLTIHLESRKVEIAGITTHPTEQWMKQMARNVTVEGSGTLRDSRYLLHDRDTKYTASFLATIESVRVKTLRLPARSPNLNAYCERWVRSTKEECLSKLILFGDRSLRRAIREYIAHYHAERNHQGKSKSCYSLKERKFVVTKL
jgi:putative transposase